MPKLAFAVLGVVMCFPLTATAATIDWAEPIGDELVLPFGGTIEGESAPSMIPEALSFSYLRHIRIEGPIEEGDAERLQSLVRDLNWDDFILISLNSAGGSFAEGLKLGDLIRSTTAATYVGRGDVCLSACALAFLSGSAMLMRGIDGGPARYLHMNGRLGFHAPFSSVLPSGPIPAGLEMADIAEMFYAISREAIRELQGRIDIWQVSPSLVFDFLGYGPNEFYEIDRIHRARLNDITLVADAVTEADSVNLIEATAACEWVLMENFATLYKWRRAWSFEGINEFYSGQGLRYAHLRVVANLVDSSGSGISFHPDAVVSGRGPFVCDIVPNSRGQWLIESRGDYPLSADQWGDTTRIDVEPVVLTSLFAFGPFVPWTAADADDLYIEDIELLDEVIPEGLRHVMEPSFQCRGQLDAPAQVICRYPILQRLDGVMGALYGEALRSEGEAVQSAQRQWLALRENACQTESANLADPQKMMMQGYCLLYLTAARVNDLQGGPY